MRGLNDRQKLFVQEYLVDFNPEAAAIRAGYPPEQSTDRAVSRSQRGRKLMNEPKIKAAIAEAIERRSKKIQITAERVLEELARIAFFDVRKLYGDDGMPLPLSQLDEDTARAVVGVERVEFGNLRVGFGEALKVKIADKKGALGLLGKHLGMFSDRLRIDGEIRQIKRVIKVPLKEFAEAAADEAIARAAGPARVDVPEKAGGWRPL